MNIALGQGLGTERVFQIPDTVLYDTERTRSSDAPYRTAPGGGGDEYRLLLYRATRMPNTVDQHDTEGNIYSAVFFIFEIPLPRTPVEITVNTRKTTHTAAHEAKHQQSTTCNTGVLEPKN